MEQHCATINRSQSTNMSQTMGTDNNDLLTGNNNNKSTKNQSNSPNDDDDDANNNEDDVTDDGIKSNLTKTINNNTEIILINNENCDKHNNNKNKVKIIDNPTTVTSDSSNVTKKVEKLDSIIKNEEINEKETLTIVISTEIVEENFDNNNSKKLTTINKSDICTSGPAVTATTTEISTTAVTTITTTFTDNRSCDSCLDSTADDTDNLSDSDVKNNKLVLKSILSGSPEKQKTILRKKSVSFDTDEETLKKFTSGEEIVDQQNPFRHPVSVIEQENAPTYKLIKFFKYNKPVIPKLIPRSTKIVDSKQEDVVVDDDFISKEEILKQSKYVPTYIKNPDKVFTYDKSVLEKYEKTLLSAKKLVPQKKSPVPCPRKSKLPQLSDFKAVKEPLIRKNSKKIARISSKSTNPNLKYPDLSDLKIKTGTDLEESLYDPSEVAQNVRKFDNRFKTISLGSQDDLDEISDLTSDQVYNNEESVTDEPDTSLVQPIKKKTKEEEPKKTLTNTVNSFEFREFLKRKGLSLVPLKSNGTGNGPLIKTPLSTNGILLNDSAPTSLITSHQNNNEEDDEDMDAKNDKKRSVLRRLFPNGLFSSRSKTTPKETTSPQPLLITKKPLAKDFSTRDPGGLKRVVLDRASFHSGTSSRSSIPANNEFTKQFSMRERSSKYKNVDDDRGSSISSVLTAADYCDVNTLPSPSLAKNSLDRSEAFKRDKKPSLNLTKPVNIEEQSVKKSGYVPVYRNIDPNRSRLYASKLRAPVLTNKVVGEEPPLSFKNESPNLSDGIVKPKVQRPSIPISSLQQLPSNGEIISPQQQLQQQQNKPPPVPMRRSSERSSLISYRKPDGAEITIMNRSISLDREMTKKKNKPPELPQRNYLVEPQYAKQLTRYPIESTAVSSQIRVNKTPIYTQNLSSNQFITPTTSNEKLLEPNCKTTSTPLSDTVSLNRSKISKSVDLSPIAKSTKRVEPRSQELDPYLYIKLHEMKRKTDNELYIKAQQEMQMQNDNIYGKPKMIIRRGSLPAETITDNIYESTERVSREYGTKQLPNQQHHYLQMNTNYQNPNFVRNSPQRNTIEGIIRSGNSKTIQNLNRYLQNMNQPVPVPMNNRMLSLQRSEVSVHQPQQTLQATPSQQPARSQSVMDGMTSAENQRIYGSIVNRQSQNATPVVMRKGGTLDKKQILKEIYEFYRRSVNSTPTKMKLSTPSGGDVLNGRSAPSPISYASLSSAKNHLINENANTIPRAHSVTADYASIGKREMMQQQLQQQVEMRKTMNDQNLYGQKRVSFIQATPSSGHTRAQTFSDSDSVFLPNSPRKLTAPIIEITPQQADNRDQSPQTTRQPFYSQQFQQQMKNEIYGRIAAKNSNNLNQQESPYGFVQARPTQNGQVYGYTRPSSALPTSSDYYLLMQQQKNQNKNLSTMQSGPLTPNQQPQQYYDRQQATSSRVMLDGRSTPLVLHAVGPQSVYKTLPKPELIYRPIQATQQQPSYQKQQQQQTPTQLQPRNVQQLRGQNTNRSTVIVNSQEYLGSDNVLYKIKPNSRLFADNVEGSFATNSANYHYPIYESESGSEVREVQRILQNRQKEEDWQNDKSGKNQQNDQALDDRRRGGRREDPRRHTLGGDMLHYAGGQGGTLQRSMDLEAPPARGYVPSSQGPLFDDDPGIMSEVETASTGFRRGGKQRSSLPVVRTPSKTLERPLGLVFLQYRSETKRALLPNEITSIDTVRALFVRSFPRQLTMAYLEGPNVKIYIHDSSKDMFYELEDVRSHLREIRDRSVLRLFESNEVSAPHVLPGGPGVPQPLPQQGGGGHWEDQSYFSEPEFDTEYQHQHVHKNKTGKGAPYYVGAAQTLPRGGMYNDRNKNSVGAPAKPLRSYGSRGSMGPQFPYPPDQLYSIPDGYMSSPERGTRGAYEEPYYSQYGTRGSSATPIIDEEQSDASLADDQYSMYGVKVSGRIPRNSNQLYDPTRPEDLHRIRVEHMERQLANLTGLVQKALIQNPQVVPVVNPNYLGVPGQYRGVSEDLDGHSSSSSTSIQANGTGEELYIRERPPKLGKSMSHKSVSFEKSVSFSDDIHGVPKSHSPQHLERDRLKPPPPPKPMGLATNQYRTDITLAPEVYNHLRGLQKKAKDLRTEVRTLRRLAQTQAVAVREDIKDTFMRIRATLLSGTGNYFAQGDQERTRISREEEVYKQEVIRLEKDLADLESSVEVLRGEVINRRTRVNMAAVEDMALVLSRASKTVADLKIKFPGLHQNLRNILANEMDQVCREEKFLKDEPDRLESALRRCKKLTGTLVTLKRLASVQEQRLPCADPQSSDDAPRSAETTASNKPIPSPRMGTVTISGGIAPENALDALLDELQTFAKPPSGSTEQRPDDSTSDDSSQTLQNTVTTKISQSSLYPSDPNASNNIGLRRLHSYPSGSDTSDTTSPPQPQRPTGKPPVPERNADLLSKVNNKRVPPPPPPRTSSRSPLASPTSPHLPQRLPSLSETNIEQQYNNNHQLASSNNNNDQGNNSSGESDNSQRQIALELRHQELLKKQKELQQQYQRLQSMSKNSLPMVPGESMMIKKTGSESNLPQKMGLNMSIGTGSMKNLAGENNNLSLETHKNEKNSEATTTTTNKVYETDIL